jgi:hypothetical protein
VTDSLLLVARTPESISTKMEAIAVLLLVHHDGPPSLTRFTSAFPKASADKPARRVEP